MQGLHAHTPLDRSQSLLPLACPPRRSASFTPNFTIHTVCPQPYVPPQACTSMLFDTLQHMGFSLCMSQ